MLLRDNEGISYDELYWWVVVQPALTAGTHSNKITTVYP